MHPPFKSTENFLAALRPENVFWQSDSGAWIFLEPRIYWRDGLPDRVRPVPDCARINLDRRYLCPPIRGAFPREKVVVAL